MIAQVLDEIDPADLLNMSMHKTHHAGIIKQVYLHPAHKLMQDMMVEMCEAADVLHANLNVHNVCHIPVHEHLHCMPAKPRVAKANMTTTTKPKVTTVTEEKSPDEISYKKESPRGEAPQPIIPPSTRTREKIDPFMIGYSEDEELETNPLTPPPYLIPPARPASWSEATEEEISVIKRI